MENTRISRYFISIALTLVLAVTISANENKYRVNFPDIPGYKTLKCDFHTHTVFSDGSVWPDIRRKS